MPVLVSQMAYQCSLRLAQLDALLLTIYAIGFVNVDSDDTVGVTSYRSDNISVLVYRIRQEAKSQRLLIAVKVGMRRQAKGPKLRKQLTFRLLKFFPLLDVGVVVQGRHNLRELAPITQSFAVVCWNLAIANTKATISARRRRSTTGRAGELLLDRGRVKGCNLVTPIAMSQQSTAGDAL